MQSFDRIRLLVMHEDPLAEAGLVAAFQRLPDFDLCDRRNVRAHDTWLTEIDVVLTSYALALQLLLEQTQERHRQPGRIIVVSGVDREWEITRAMASGVCGYAVVGCPIDELVSAARDIHRGSRYLSSRAAARLAESAYAQRLTTREEAVLQLVVDGLGNKAIGRRLGVAVATVKSHLRTAFQKLGADTRTQAIAIIERRGLLDAGAFRPCDDKLSSISTQRPQRLTSTFQQPSPSSSAAHHNHPET